ncbi:MAG: hypothetical protein HY752_00995 [Nitrospirae bacterium]|nr:hypothetical protein [Nitrospirota bacterium]
MSKDICIVCAWRENCQKRFSAKSKDFRCPDFVRDVSIPRDREDAEVCTRRYIPEETASKQKESHSIPPK